MFVCITGLFFHDFNPLLWIIYFIVLFNSSIVENMENLPFFKSVILIYEIFHLFFHIMIAIWRKIMKNISSSTSHKKLVWMLILWIRKYFNWLIDFLRYLFLCKIRSYQNFVWMIKLYEETLFIRWTLTLKVA